MHFEKLQSGTRRQKPAWFFGTSTCRRLDVLAALTEAKGNGIQLLIYDDPRSPALLLGHRMRPSRSCFEPPEGKMVCFQSKMTRPILGNNNDHVNPPPQLAFIFVLFFVLVIGGKKKKRYRFAIFTFYYLLHFSSLNLLLHCVLPLFSSLNPFLFLVKNQVP